MSCRPCEPLPDDIKEINGVSRDRIALLHYGDVLCWFVCDADGHYVDFLGYPTESRANVAAKSRGMVPYSQL